MNIAVTITLGADDTLAYTPDAAATQVLAALGGDPTKDYCACSVQQAAMGEAGIVADAVAETPPDERQG